ncbi:hypothetical protein D3C86_1622130 [compost metagenome]
MVDGIRIVDGRRIADLPTEGDIGIKALRLETGDLLDALLQLLSHDRIHRPHADLQHGGIGNDVRGRAGLERAHRHDRRLMRRDVARHKRLQCHDDA